MKQSSAVRPAVRSNRRLDRRLPPKGFTKATCRKGIMDLGKNIAIDVLDVAETGVRLLFNEPVQANEEVVVTLECPNHYRPLRHVGEVMWCVETAEHNYCVGIRFRKRVNYPDLAKLT